MRPLLYLIALCCPTFATPFPASAASFPEKPLRLIVPFAPGDAIDNTARVLAERMQELLGQPVVVQNIAGGGGSVGIADAKRSPEDGYTLVVISTGAMTAGPLISKSGFEPSDFTPVARLVTMPMAVAVSGNSPYKTMQELVEASRTRELAFSTPGASSKQRITMTGFAKDNGMHIIHVAGKSGMDATIKVMAGEVDFVITAAPVFEALAKSGKLRVLAVGADEQVPYLPGTPTFKELGYKSIDQLWFGVVVRKEVPTDVLETLEKTIADAAAQQNTKDMYKQLRYTDGYLSGPAFAQVIDTNLAEHTEILKDIGLVK